MKPREKKPETVYRIINRSTGEPEGSYSRAYCDEYDFDSVSQARGANCHDIFEDKVKYGIAKYRVIYELIEDDVDPPSKEEIIKATVEKSKDYWDIPPFLLDYIHDQAIKRQLTESEIASECFQYHKENART